MQHGSALFPIACYEERLTCYSVPWHWHEDFEYILAYEGTVTVGVDKSASVWRKARVCSSTPVCSMRWNLRQKVPQRCAAGVPPAARGRDGHHLLAKLIRPLLQPGVPSYFLLSKGSLGRRKFWPGCGRLARCGRRTGRLREPGSVSAFGGAAHLAAHCPVGECRSSRQEQVAAQRMKQMLRFVEEHYAEELTVERIADSVALSESACLRSFRQLLGTTPIQYVKQYRIEKPPGCC